MIKYCPECGEKIHNTAKYCGKCGYPFTGREKSGKYYSKLKKSRNIKLLIVTVVTLFFIFGITNFSRTSGSKGHIQKINVAQHTEQQVAHSLSPPNNAAQYNKPQVVHSSLPPKVISSGQNVIKENKNQPKLYEYHLIYYDVKSHKTSTEAQIWINEKDQTVRIKIDKWFKHSDKTVHYTRKGMRFYFENEYLDIYLQPRFGLSHLARAYYKHGAYYFKWSRTEIT